MNDEDAYGEDAYGSPEDLLRQIEWIRLAMLGAQKELGALAESMRESLAQPWPALFDQLAELQALLADLRAELRFYHRTSLGQLPIAPCFPPRAEPQYMHLGLGETLERLCQDATILWVRVGSSSFGYSEVTLRCELDLTAARAHLPDLALRSPIVDVHLLEARTVNLRFGEGGYWGGERVNHWEVTRIPGTHPDPPCRHRILGSRGSMMEIEPRQAAITEVWD